MLVDTSLDNDYNLKVSIPEEHQVLAEPARALARQGSRRQHDGDSTRGVQSMDHVMIMGHAEDA